MEQGQTSVVTFSSLKIGHTCHSMVLLTTWSSSCPTTTTVPRPVLLLDRLLSVHPLSLQLNGPWWTGHQRLKPTACVSPEQLWRPGDSSERRAPWACHRLWRHRLGLGLWFLGAREAEPLCQHRVAPLQVWPGPAATGNRPQQWSHQDLGRLHW